MEGKIYGELKLENPVVIKSWLLCRSIFVQFFRKATANVNTVEAPVSRLLRDAK